MAAPTDSLNDTRWAGLDSQSLPDRPAHPDPSKLSEVAPADEVPSHGIVGHLDAKIGLTSDEALLADRAQYHQGVVEQLEAEKRVWSARPSDDATKAHVKGLDESIAHHKGLAKGAKDAPLDPGAAVREAVLSGDIETAPEVDVTKADVDKPATTEAKH